MNPTDPLAQYAGSLSGQSISQQSLNAALQNRKFSAGSGIASANPVWTENINWPRIPNTDPFDGFINSQEYNEALDKYLMRIYIQSENAIKAQIEKETKQKEEEALLAKEARHQAYLKLKEEFESVSS